MSPSNVSSRSHHGDAASRGLADLLVTRTGWGNRWMALEVKRGWPHDWSSAEQRAEVEAGRVAIVTSLEEALEVIRKAVTR